MVSSGGRLDLRENEGGRGFAAPEGTAKEIAAQTRPRSRRLGKAMRFKEFMNRRGFNVKSGEFVNADDEDNGAVLKSTGLCGVKRWPRIEPDRSRARRSTQDHRLAFELATSICIRFRRTTSEGTPWIAMIVALRQATEMPSLV